MKNGWHALVFVSKYDVVRPEVIFRGMFVAALTQFELVLGIVIFLNGGLAYFCDAFFCSYHYNYSVVRITNLLHRFDPSRDVQSLPTLSFLHPK